MLLDEELNDIIAPTLQFCHDWMHAIFVNGVFNVITFLLCKALKNACVSDVYSRFEHYIATWVLPRRLGSSKQLSSMFSKKRETADEKAKVFKCQASDGLTAIAVIAVYVQKVFMKAGLAIAECTAFLHLANIVDLLVAVPSGRIQPDTLRDSIGPFLDSCVAAGWRARMIPKFHWLVHAPRHLHSGRCFYRASCTRGSTGWSSGIPMT